MTQPDISNESIKAKTGRGWAEWIKVIDGLGGADMTHKEIVQKLYEKSLGTNGWWRQSITVGYEKIKGRRVLGQTADQGFEVGVHKTLPVERDELWEFLLSRQGLKLWLGTLEELILERKQPYKTAEDTEGEVRTFKESEFIRMTWQPRGRRTPTTLQIRMNSTGENKTRFSFHHEKLEDPKDREAMRDHWRDVTEKIAKALA